MTITTLPIEPKRHEFEEAFRTHQVVIVVGETGSGKSTQIGQYLLDMGETAIITQPRRLPTMALAARVAAERGERLGSTVGYRMSGVKVDSDETDLLFATDGLTLVRELMDDNDFSVLCLDEVHEWGLNMEVLLAWARRELEEDDSFKLVIMSATLDVAPLVEWFGGKAAVVTVPGRNYPTTWRHSSMSISYEAAAFLRAGKDVLVFEPGRDEIMQTERFLQGLNIEAVILPLHGDLTQNAQALCLKNYDKPKCIIASPLAQTGLTLPGVVVVDSGLERRVEVDVSQGEANFGIEALVLANVAQDTLLQRAGRTGRTEPGEYVLCSPVRFEDRPQYSTPEIQRSLLESVVLRLKLADTDIDELELFHAPDAVAVEQAKTLLRLLGALDEHDVLTEIGYEMALLPVSPRTARMLLEAKKRGVIREMIACAAIIEQGGLIERKSDAWQPLKGDECDSDVLAHFAVWHAAHKAKNYSSPLESGVNVRAFHEVERRIEQLCIALNVKSSTVRQERAMTAVRREALLVSVIAGMVDQLYERTSNGFVHGKDHRQLGKYSVLPSGERWIVGRPRNVPDRKNNAVFYIISMATKAAPLWLASAAPHLAELREGLDVAYDKQKDAVTSTSEFWFNGCLIWTHRTIASDHPQAEQLRLEARNRQLTDKKRPATVPVIPLPDVMAEEMVIPDIVTYVHKEDANLQWYGTVALYENRISGDPWLKIMWTPDKGMAERHHLQVIDGLAALRHEAQATTEPVMETESRWRALLRLFTGKRKG